MCGVYVQALRQLAFPAFPLLPACNGPLYAPFQLIAQRPTSTIAEGKEVEKKFSRRLNLLLKRSFLFFFQEFEMINGRV